MVEKKIVITSPVCLLEENCNSLFERLHSDTAAQMQQLTSIIHHNDHLTLWFVNSSAIKTKRINWSCLTTLCTFDLVLVGCRSRNFCVLLIRAGVSNVTNVYVEFISPVFGSYGAVKDWLNSGAGSIPTTVITHIISINLQLAETTGLVLNTSVERLRLLLYPPNT